MNNKSSSIFKPRFNIDQLSAIGCALFFLAHIGYADVSVAIIAPTSNVIAHEQLSVIATVSSTFELQSVQASVEGRTVGLVYTTAAYKPCNFCSPAPGWTNAISLVGLNFGTKTLTVTAVDVLGNSNQAQLSFIFDLPPVLNLTLPPNGTVARTNLHVIASSSDDAPAVPTIQVRPAIDYGSLGPVLATGSGTLDTNLSFSDGQALSLLFRASDSANQKADTFRLVYVQGSSNLVDVARASDGEIQDVQTDHLLSISVQNGSLTLGNSDANTVWRLLDLTRTNSAETSVFEGHLGLGPAFLSPQGAIFIASGSPLRGYSQGFLVHQVRGTNLVEHGFHGGGNGIGMLASGNFAAWGWGDSGGYTPQLYLTDLAATNTSLVINASGYSDLWFDVAPNGDVVVIPLSSLTGHVLYRYRGGVLTTLTNDAVNSIKYPKTDGSNVCYVKVTTTNQMLMLINGGGESKVAEGVAIGSDLQINNGWIAYTRNGGSGQMQVWRRSPDGISTQLTIFGSSSAMAALAPNGEVAMYNGLHLYISKGSWPPADIAISSSTLFNSITPALRPFWQNDRWFAVLGRSFFQIYTGLPQIVSPRLNSSNQFCFDLVGANGQRIVTEASADLVHWTNLTTNNITDGGGMTISDPVQSNSSGRYYRLRLN